MQVLGNFACVILLAIESLSFVGIYLILSSAALAAFSFFSALSREWVFVSEVRRAVSVVYIYISLEDGSDL